MKIKLNIKIIIIVIIIVNLYITNCFALSIGEICFNLINITNKNSYIKNLEKDIKTKEIFIIQNNLEYEYDISKIIDEKKKNAYFKVLPLEYLETILSNNSTEKIVLLIDLSEIFQYKENSKKNIIKDAILFEQNFGSSDKQIGSKEEFLFNNKQKFLDNSSINQKRNSELLDEIRIIKEKCYQKNIDLEINILPIYKKILTEDNQLMLDSFYNELKNITEYKSYSTQYFIDDSRYFDNYLSINNQFKLKLIQDIINKEENLNINEEEYEVQIPILLYHHIDENVTSDMVVTPEKFEHDLIYLKENGYNVILLENIIKYVKEGINLPENPICITFDDGYTSNYEYAYPLLKKYDMKATIFIIGSSVGKGINDNVIPHFNYVQAKEMIDSKIIDIKSHTYDMHQLTKENARKNILKLEDEKIEEYLRYRRNDYNNMNSILSQKLNIKNNIIAYPQGKTDNISSEASKILGYEMTLTTVPDTNYILKYLPESLYNLNRYNITQETNLNDIIK